MHKLSNPKKPLSYLHLFSVNINSRLDPSVGRNAIQLLDGSINSRRERNISGELQIRRNRVIAVQLDAIVHERVDGGREAGSLDLERKKKLRAKKLTLTICFQKSAD